MTRKDFDFIIDTVGEATGKRCPETFVIILWGKYQNWDAIEFAELILDDIKLNNNK